MSGGQGDALQFGLLGRLEVKDGPVRVPVPGGRQQTILALLLLDAGRAVPRSRMVEAVWASDPPSTATDQVYICISSLRRRLRGAAAPVIETSRSGYVLHVDDDQLDTSRFAALAATGSAQAAAGDLPEAVATLRSALALWRDAALEGLDSAVLRRHARRLDEARFAVWQDCLDLELRLGRHRRAIGELTEAVARHPVHERLHLQLMAALAQAGRRADALQVHRWITDQLREQQGLAPGPGLRAAHEAILAGETGAGVLGAEAAAGGIALLGPAGPGPA